MNHEFGAPDHLTSLKTFDHLVYLFGMGVLIMMFKVLLDMVPKKRTIHAKMTVGPVSNR